MKTTTILVSILFIGLMNTANAQETDNKPINSATRKNNTTTYEIRGDAKKTGNELNKLFRDDEVEEGKTVKVIVDNTAQTVFLQFDTARMGVENIKRKLQKKGYVLIKNEIVAAQPKPPAEKYNPEIDKFLNLEDSSIFKDKFMKLEDNKIPPRSRSYYQLINKIHTLDDMLLKPDLTTIRTDLDTMGKLIDEIKPAKNLLPPPLLDYYKSLTKKYGEVYDQINP
jgi:hypothetical protein